MEKLGFNCADNKLISHLSYKYSPKTESNGKTHSDGTDFERWLDNLQHRSLQSISRNYDAPKKHNSHQLFKLKHSYTIKVKYWLKPVFILDAGIKLECTSEVFNLVLLSEATKMQQTQHVTQENCWVKVAQWCAAAIDCKTAGVKNHLCKTATDKMSNSQIKLYPGKEWNKIWVGSRALAGTQHWRYQKETASQTGKVAAPFMRWNQCFVIKIATLPFKYYFLFY